MTRTAINPAIVATIVPSTAFVIKMKASRIASNAILGTGGSPSTVLPNNAEPSRPKM